MLAPHASVSSGSGRSDAALVAAARDFGTPVYVIDVATVASAAAMMEAAFPRPWVWQYSLKANDLPAIAAYLAQRGWGANVVSLGEWRHAHAAGVANDRVSLEGIGKTDAELEYAVQQAAAGTPFRWLAIESPDEADRLGELAREYGLGRAAGHRWTCCSGSTRRWLPRHGRSSPSARATASSGWTSWRSTRWCAAGLGSPGLRLRGIHVHAGSDLRDVTAWAEAGVAAVGLASRLASLVDTVDTVDVGGGFPAPTDDAPRPAQFIAALEAGLEQRGLTLPPRHAIEPGRFLVGHAGWLVSQVLHSRPRRDLPQQTVLDAGMTELVRPALYGSHHDIRPLEGSLTSTSETPAQPELCPPRWKGRSASSPTRSAPTSCRGSDGVTWSRSRAPAPTRARSPPATTAAHIRRGVALARRLAPALRARLGSDAADAGLTRLPHRSAGGRTAWCGRTRLRPGSGGGAWLAVGLVGPARLQCSNGRRPASPGNSPVAEVVELGAHAELGGRPEPLVDVGIDAAYDVHRLHRSARQRIPDLVEPLGPVREVLLDDRKRLVEHRAVAGPDRLDLLLLREVAQPPQRPEIGAELPVRVRHHRRTAPEHGVAGEHRPVRRHHEAQRVAGVARGADHPDLESVHLDDVSVMQPLVAVHERGVERPDTAPDPLGERPRTLAVVGMAMREEYGDHIAGNVRRPHRGGRRRGVPGRPRSTGRRPRLAAPRCSCRRASSGRRWAPAGTPRGRRSGRRPNPSRRDAWRQRQPALPVDDLDAGHDGDDRGARQRPPGPRRLR